MILPRVLESRYYYNCNAHFYGNNCHSAWYSWGRWVLTGVLVGLAVLLICFCLCCRGRGYGRRSSRSRSRSTRSSRSRHHRGTYATPMDAQQRQAYYNKSGRKSGYNANYDGYYGQQGGVTQPQNVYTK